MSCRKRLFSMINDLPTVFEVVTERKPVKDKPSVDSGSKSRGSIKVIDIFLFSFLCFSQVALNIFKSDSLSLKKKTDELSRVVNSKLFISTIVINFYFGTSVQDSSCLL